LRSAAPCAGPECGGPCCQRGWRSPASARTGRPARPGGVRAEGLARAFHQRRDRGAAPHDGAGERVSASAVARAERRDRRRERSTTPATAVKTARDSMALGSSSVNCPTGRIRTSLISVGTHLGRSVIHRSRRAPLAEDQLSDGKDCFPPPNPFRESFGTTLDASLAPVTWTLTPP
jgi:hypothetical protein